MTHFEYLAVGTSVLFALALGRTLTIAPFLFRSGRFDPLFSFIYFVFCYWLLGLWWVLWENSTFPSWDFFGYLLLIATPLTYYLISLVLVPNEPESVHSWKDHYETICRQFSGLYAFTFVVGTSRLMYLENDFGWLGTLFSVPFVIVTIIGSTTTNRAFHWLLGVSLFVFLTFRIFGRS